MFTIITELVSKVTLAARKLLGHENKWFCVEIVFLTMKSFRYRSDIFEFDICNQTLHTLY